MMPCRGMGVVMWMGVSEKPALDVDEQCLTDHGCCVNVGSQLHGDEGALWFVRLRPCRRAAVMSISLWFY